MALDIKEKIEEIVKKITSDDDLKENFRKDPMKAVENLLGVDLPNEAIEKIVEGVKAKVSLDGITGAFDKLKKIF